jgi:hypothetical protein
LSEAAVNDHPFIGSFLFGIRRNAFYNQNSLKHNILMKMDTGYQVQFPEICQWENSELNNASMPFEYCKA